MGRVVARTVGNADGEVRTKEAWTQMETVAKLCNQVCKEAALPWYVNVPGLDSEPSDWMRNKEAGASRGRVKCVYNWAVMTGAGLTESYADVSC
jgi:hypothetical protein